MTYGIDDSLAAVREAAEEVMDVEDVMLGAHAGAFRQQATKAPAQEDLLMLAAGMDPAQRDRIVRVRGRLRMASYAAYDLLARRLTPLGRTPLLRRDDESRGEVILALPGTMRAPKQRVRLAAILFTLTVVSCLFVGAQMPREVALSGQLNTNLLDGIPFAAALLAILLAHEFGHYLVGRRFGLPVSLPYFIPMPFGPFGTLGAVISMSAPPRSRRHLLALAVAGPLAGLVLAVPILWLGLSLSAVEPLPAGNYAMEGNSLLYIALKALMFGRFLPSGGQDVWVHPVAFAGWAGLLVTALNLIPAGQLDGGHIVFALAGERVANIVYWVVLAALALLSFIWVGWLLWVGLVFFVGRLRAPLLDDLTELTQGQRVLAAAMVVIFVLIFTPVPLTIVP